MVIKYFCASCDEEFTSEESSGKPRCPKCMRKSGVEVVRSAEKGAAKGRKRFWIAGAIMLLVGAGLAVHRATSTRLEEKPPLQPLETRELRAYLERDQIRVGAYDAMFVLPADVEAWPDEPTEVAKQINRRSSPWSLEQSLPRPVLTADQTLAALKSDHERAELYPIEAATALTALLRARGVEAMVAEVSELPGEQAPADPSGSIGYFVTAVYEAGATDPSEYLDPWGGRDLAQMAPVRVLRDTEVIAAALGTEAKRVFTRSGDGTKALPMVETALLLDPVSPSLRIVHATVLLESGGVAQAVKELEAAVQLRPTGPFELNLVQLFLVQAGMLEANGQSAAAETQLAEANRRVADLLDRWPRYARAHLTLATIYLALEDPARAEVALQTAGDLSPDAPMLSLVYAQYHLAQNDPFAAASKIKRAVELDSENWQMRLQAAQILQAAGEREAARENADAAIRLVAPSKRAELREYLDRVLGADTAGGFDDLDPLAGAAQAPPSGEVSDPSLMLGEPSKLRLRDPGEELDLDLDLQLDE